MHGVIGDGDDNGHFEDELEEVGPEDSPEAAERDVEAGEGDEKKNTDGQRRTIGASPDPAERGDPSAYREQQRGATESDSDNAGHGLGDPSEDDAVHEQAEVDGAEAAQEGGRFAAITDLGKLYVGEQSAAPPETGEEEDGHHAGEQRSPPEPVSADALGVDQAGDDQRRVGGKGGGDHRGSGQPPVHAAAGDKVVIHTFGGALAEAEAEQDGDCEISEDGQPIEKREGHKIRCGMRWRKANTKAGKDDSVRCAALPLVARLKTRAKAGATRSPAPR